MGISTSIYGSIVEMDFWPGSIRKEIREHNEKVIGSLSLSDSWPPLSREMFGICRNSDWPAVGPDLEYGGRIIHFGANTKSIEYDWGEWKLKFERLLKSLFWLEARVHFKAEYAAFQSFEWRVDLLRYRIADKNIMPLPIQEIHWDFAGSDWPEKIS